MYKIYINDTPLLLEDTTQLPSLVADSEKKLVGMYNGKTKLLLQFIDMMEKTDRYETVTIHYHDLEKLWSDFKSLYKKMDAAGGVVYNEDQEVLLIYRRGHWDLPKGKVDPGETVEAAAVREVQEETGIRQIKQGDLLHKTWHTFFSRKGKRVLKRTYWYHMNTTDRELIPQAEEDIEEAVWRNLADFLAKPPKTYGNIIDTLNLAISLEK